MEKPPPLVAPVRQPDWIARNWKWFVPLLCVFALLIIAGFVVGIFAVMKSSDVYTGAVARARSNPAVIAALGTPVSEGFFVTGNISENNSSGNANLVISLSGPSGSAKLNVLATRSNGDWHFDELMVLLDKTHQQIDLLNTNQPSGTVSVLKSPSNHSPN